MEKKYKHKSVTFDPKNEQDMALWNWLKSLGHGEFVKRTKEYWLEQMRKEEGK